MNTALESSHRRISRAAGIAYVLTFVSIPTLALYVPVKGANSVTNLRFNRGRVALRPWVRRRWRGSAGCSSEDEAAAGESLQG
jgi:hypothetical protein